MPGKNVLKIYVRDAFYHLYNRGVDKRKIFLDSKDYLVFLSLLKKYLSPSINTILGSPKKNLYEEVDLICFCLMPNHYHLLVKQTSATAITQLIRRLCTHYVMYFNQRYQRTGTLFEGRYKAVLIETDEQLLHLSRYIHLNPQLAGIQKASDYPYSSYLYYLGKKRSLWVKPKEVLSFFSGTSPNSTYQSFIDDHFPKTSLDTNLLLEEGPSLAKDGP